MEERLNGRKKDMNEAKVNRTSFQYWKSCLAYFSIDREVLGLYRICKSFPVHSTPVPKTRRRF